MSDTAPVLDPATIHGYHAHVYYTDEDGRARAALLRDRLGQSFPEAVLGRWHDKLVGPHTQSMYQVAFPTALLPTLLPFLMLNRRGLTILVHPETGHEYDDHVHHSAWLGQVLALNAHVLKGAPDKAAG